MNDDDLLAEQNELLRALVRLMIDERLEPTEEKAKFLAQFDFTHQQIADILDRDRTTISGHLGSDD